VVLNPNPDAFQYLAQVRSALDKDNYALADQLSHKMQGYFSESYAPVGDLLMHQDYEGEATGYYRDLDITRAISTVRFTAGGIKYVREMFVSYPDQAIILHLTSSQERKIKVNFSLRSQLHPVIRKDADALVMTGRAPSHADPTYMNTSDKPVQWDDPNKGMRVQTDVKVLSCNGRVNVSDQKIDITDASDVTLAISIATSFNGFDKYPYSQGKDEHQLANAYMNQLNGKTYATLKARHIKDYTGYYDRVKFSVEGNEDAEKLPTDARLKKYQTDRSDHGLEALLYNYGRYLIISSSRKGGPASNLQGLWNVDLRPAWSCNYTVNINLEMNYWAADKVGLSDMSWPLVSQVQHMAETGKYIARNYYHCRGWAAGHNSDIWALTNPVGHLGMGDPQWANWIMAGVWLCQNIYDKYEFSGDKGYLRDIAYPLMKSAAQFCLDWLVDDGHGHLITSPSTSPENRFLGKDGKTYAVTKGATMDLALIRNLFENVMFATAELKTDKQFRDTVYSTMLRMLPYQIGKHGNIQEWAQDYDEPDPTHRHVSHLACLYPGRDIYASDPALFNACKKTLERRGDGGTGWSRCWKVCFWARLLDGDHAYRLLQNDLKFTDDRGFSENGGTYPNLFNACPPYQIDGNYGIVEGISEMLVQSHQRCIHLLPALPSAWKSGRIDGIRARGGYTLSIEWQHATLKTAALKSIRDQNCSLKAAYPLRISGVKAQLKVADTAAGKQYIYYFNVKKGVKYIITKA
jgi:alpha-L-fucosidase 2